MITVMVLGLFKAFASKLRFPFSPSPTQEGPILSYLRIAEELDISLYVVLNANKDSTQIQNQGYGNQQLFVSDFLYVYNCYCFFFSVSSSLS